MNRDRIGAILGAVLGGALWGLALAGLISLIPWCKYESAFSVVCPFVCSVVSLIYLCILRAPDKSFFEEERPDLVSSMLGEFAAALPVSLVAAPLLAVLFSFLP